ncbi:MAG TPA: DUF2516 family protein [Actinomycetaceae bacterium]|nr:DUF2516 family protein [Actinomycetaceae bacterium]
MALYFWLIDILQWVVSVPLFAIEVFALADAAGRPGALFEANMKRPKTFWIALLAIGALFGLASLPFLQLPPNLFLTVLAVLPAGIYLADVRPALRGRQW